VTVFYFKRFGSTSPSAQLSYSLRVLKFAGKMKFVVVIVILTIALTVVWSAGDNQDEDAGDNQDEDAGDNQDEDAVYSQD
jgi:hypothetical protein